MTSYKKPQFKENLVNDENVIYTGEYDGPIQFRSALRLCQMR